MATLAEVATGAAGYRGLSQGDLLAALVYLLNQSGPNLTATELQSESACYKCMSHAELAAAAVYLLANSDTAP